MGVNIRDRRWGYTPLHHCAYFGRIDCAHILLDAKADPSIPNCKNNTAADVALYQNRQDLRQLLMKASSANTSRAEPAGIAVAAAAAPEESASSTYFSEQDFFSSVEDWDETSGQETSGHEGDDSGLSSDDAERGVSLLMPSTRGRNLRNRLSTLPLPRLRTRMPRGREAWKFSENT